MVDGLLVVFDAHAPSRRLHCEFAPPCDDYAKGLVDMLQTEHFRDFLFDVAHDQDQRFDIIRLDLTKAYRRWKDMLASAEEFESRRQGQRRSESNGDKPWVMIGRPRRFKHSNRTRKRRRRK